MIPRGRLKPDAKHVGLSMKCFLSCYIKLPQSTIDVLLFLKQSHASVLETAPLLEKGCKKRKDH